MSGSGRTWALRGAAVLFGLSLLVAAEVGLRASGTWADPPLPTLPQGWEEGGRWASSDARGAIVPTTVDGSPGAQVAAHLAGSMMAARQWTLAPAPDTTRVFAFGGSTTLGVPVERDQSASFPGRAEKLGDAMGRRLEIVNLGGAGFSSTEVVDLVDQVRDHGAAAWVVYSANNEFFRFALDNHQANQGYPSPRANLGRLHLFRALEDLLSQGPPPVVDVDAATAQQRAVIARVVAGSMVAPDARPVVDAEGRWRRTDPAMKAVVGRYRENLERVEQAAAQAGAAVYIVDVRAHLQQQPWLSLHGPDVPGRVRDQVVAAVADSRSALDQGRTADALSRARSAVEADPVYAAGWHALGMALLAGDDLPGAELALRNALDLDMDPGRPPTALTEVVAEVTADGGSRRIDLAPIWDRAEFGPFGHRLFHDSCHLTREGYAEVGKLVGMTLAVELPPPGSP